MARPTTKESLLTQSDENYQKLMDLIDSMSPAEQEQVFSFEDRDKNVRDVLIHLHEWHNMMESWYTDGMAGEKPAIPAPGYTFKTTPELNLKIWESYQDTPLADAKELLQKSADRMIQLIEQHTDEELFTKKYYKWTNTTSLGAYFISSTSSHYDWALKKLRQHKKSL
ncbi:ClbS/DfsB family four-helix bundle protein [Enterococcus sp. BWM-S5]|uniref:ClbS/DfsB family four-helix bundle protein n=1 Tax=Enterococcus larvae TaxID=2794352 RepID=A0ABS4CFG7_9ENTE|nr:ClbS/DfsB family four-helix bundle protein [Enterococcus larvae]MBP1045163.1 ClbS/DfsB family four-helix bundle protein [Enterococcus larvae]